MKLRSRVSKPNKEKGKDYPTLIADLIKVKNDELEGAIGVSEGEELVI